MDFVRSMLGNTVNHCIQTDKLIRPLQNHFVGFRDILSERLKL